MSVTTLSASADSHIRRQAMIDSQLRPSDVIEPRLIRAVGTVAREDFVPAEQAARAYSDRSVPLADGRALNPVLATARSIAELDLQAGSHVLLIGAATGYAAALLAQMGVQVTAVEEHGALASQARHNLRDQPLVTVVEGPLARGAPDGAPFDALLIDGAVETLPPALLDQLANGARVVTGLVDGPVTRLARTVRVEHADAVAPLPFADMECAALPGFAAPAGFQF